MEEGPRLFVENEWGRRLFSWSPTIPLRVVTFRKYKNSFALYTDSSGPKWQSTYIYFFTVDLHFRSTTENDVPIEQIQNCLWRQVCVAVIASNHAFTKT